jgi:hypothetical protein
VKRADTASMQGPQAARPGAPGRAVPGPVSRRPRALARAGIVLVAAGALAGCNFMNPATVLEPYSASDGVNVDLDDTVLLRNILVVADEEGGRGSVVGMVVNQGEEPVTVELAAQLGENAQPGQTRVQVPPSGNVLLGPEGLGSTEMILEDLPVAPGEVIEMSAASSGTGVAYFDAPVLPAEGEYASLTAPPTTPPATPTEQPTGTPSAEESDAAGGTGTGQSGDEPTGDASESATEEPTGTP